MSSSVAVQGSVSGQLAVGNYNVQVGEVHGGVVTIVAAKDRLPAIPRARPVLIRGRPMAGFVDRANEVARAERALAAGVPVQLFGGSGFGKSAMLRAIVHRPGLVGFTDGTALIRVDGDPVEDVLLHVYDTFFARDPDARPTTGELRVALQNLDALIALDDVNLDREASEELLSALPSAAVVFASLERRLWGEGEPIAVEGLPLAEAISLVERDVRRPLNADERVSLESSWRACLGSPLELLQLASTTGEAGGVVTAGLAGPPPPESDVSADERRMLGILALAGGELPRARVRGMMGGATTDATALALERRGMLRADDDAIRLADGARRSIRALWDLSDAAYVLSSDLFADGAAAEMRSAARHVLEWLADAGRWPEALALVRGIEPGVSLAGYFGAWGQLLSVARRAADAAGDGEALAWALHESGVRDLLLDRPASAVMLLGRALHLRESLGDVEGAAISRGNLDVARTMAVPGAIPRGGPDHWDERPATGRGLPRVVKGGLLLGGAAIVAGAAALVTSLALENNEPAQTGQPTVAPTPIALAGDMTVEASGPDGAAVTFVLPEGVECDPASGDTFPVGETVTVRCTAGGADAGSFRVTVEDTTAPVITGPATIGSLAAVTFDDIFAVDAVDGEISRITCRPAPGQPVASGEQTVRCTASDASGNEAEATFVIRVAPRADLAVASPNIELDGNANGCTVTYVVQNRGRGTAPASRARVTVSGQPLASALQTVPEIAPGGRTTLETVVPGAAFCRFNPDSSGQIALDVENAVIEEDETNNVQPWFQLG